MKNEGKMLGTNTVLLKLAKRAETYDVEHLVESFVDIGPVFTILSNSDHQILFGRRGTGKTHVLAYLASEMRKKEITVVQLDMRLIGSTGGIFSDSNIPVAQRATRLLVDTLSAIHSQILEATIESAEDGKLDLSVLGPVLDGFINASTEVVVDGDVKQATKEVAQSGGKANASASVGLASGVPSLNVGAGAEDKTDSSFERIENREGPERMRVNFGTVGRSLEKLVKALPKSQLWIVMDEWSEIPLELQPYLAELIRRSMLPVRGVVAKIAAIEQRSRFRISDRSGGHMGIEVGADAAAAVNLDEYLVFESDPALAMNFFRDLLFRHIKALVGTGNEIAMPATPSELINMIFTQRPAFEEFVRSTEGVPRDGLNILAIAAQKALDNQISVPDIRVAARTWYMRAKQGPASSRPDAQALLNWIIDDVIQHRQAKAFLLSADVRDDLVDFLYDERILHVIKQGVSGGDVPGKRFNVYALDYGCYVDLINTTKAPKGLFEAEHEGQSGFVDVPRTDFRSIRRAILELGPFYEEAEKRMHAKTRADFAPLGSEGPRQL